MQFFLISTFEGHAGAPDSLRVAIGQQSAFGRHKSKWQEVVHDDAASPNITLLGVAVCIDLPMLRSSPTATVSLRRNECLACGAL